MARDFFHRQIAAPQRDAIADFRFDAAQIDRDQIHRDAADDRRASPLINTGVPVCALRG